MPRQDSNTKVFSSPPSMHPALGSWKRQSRGTAPATEHPFRLRQGKLNAGTATSLVPMSRSTQLLGRPHADVCNSCSHNQRRRSGCFNAKRSCHSPLRGIGESASIPHDKHHRLPPRQALIPSTDNLTKGDSLRWRYTNNSLSWFGQRNNPRVSELYACHEPEKRYSRFPTCVMVAREERFHLFSGQRITTQLSSTEQLAVRDKRCQGLRRIFRWKAKGGDGDRTLICLADLADLICLVGFSLDSPASRPRVLCSSSSQATTWII